MAEMSDLEQAMRKRMMRMIEEAPMPMQGAPLVNVYAGALPQTVSETMSLGGGMSTQKQMQATQAGISPEELEYLVDISKRDVKEQVGTDPESGEPVYKNVGWDKKVHRYTMPAENTGEGNRDRSGLADWAAGGPNTDQPGDAYAVLGDTGGIPAGPPKRKRKQQKDSKGLSIFEVE
jgi:hypothetical protein